ncbi:MAG: AAA family ATPase, partial [Synergistales bacterium]|nr:AAA family ATPase [Synergistales bacterium]
MPEIIAVANQKGGVGKTSLSVNLSSGIAHLLKARQMRVLVIDSDHQANATYLLSTENIDYKDSLASIYQEDLMEDPEKLIMETRIPFLDLVPASPFMASEEMRLAHRERKGERLKLFLRAVGRNYSVIFIDCPPAINLFVLNAFFAATRVLVPLPPEDLAIQGFEQLMNQVH